MAKFKVLDLSKVLKTRFGIYAYRLTDPNNDFFKSYATYHVLFFLVPIFVISGSLFAYKNLDQVILALKTVFMVMVGFQAAALFLSVGLNMRSVKNLHQTLQEIVDEGT